MADNKRVSAKKARRNKIWGKIAIAAGAVALVAVILVSYFTSTTYYRQKTAVEIADHDISVAAFNYYYQNAYQNTYSAIQETYGDYASMLIDTSKPLSEQQYSETQTWEDYLTDTTLSNLSEIYAYYDEAVKNGYTLDESAQAEIEEIVETVSTAAKRANYSLNNYLGAVYGKGVNEKLYRELLNVVSIATEYAADVEAGFTFTAEETEAYYEENSSKIDSVSARLYPISYVTPDEDAEEEESEDVVTYEDALALANDGLASIRSEQDFVDYVLSIVPEESQSKYESSSATLYNGLSYSSFNNADLSDWLFDEARTAGDTTVIEGESEVYLVMFISRSDNDYPLVDMRHVLIAPEKDEDGNLVDGAEDAAKAKAEELYDEWVENGSTEDYFEILANTYSDDGDGTTGGLYEDIYKGRMVAPIDEWLFGPRKTGDCELIETEYGWHIVYFAGVGENYKAQLLDTAMRNDAYEAWRTAALEGHEAVTVESGFKLTR